MIPLWQLRCLAVWYQAGYRYRLLVGRDRWRFTFWSSTGGSSNIQFVKADAHVGD